MASQDSKLISLMAGKMGVDSDSALRKASEFLRLLQLRMTASSCLRQLNDTSQIIMCLDLACNWLGHPFDKTGVVRLSGLTKKQYLNGLNLIENLLGLSKPVNVDTLCVQLGVSEVAAFAQKLLNMYVEKHAHGPKPINTNLSVYHCVAVFLACKFHKVKVEKPKLIEASRVKKIAFDKLLGDFSPFVEVLGTKEGKQTTKRSHNLIDLVSKLEDNKQDDIMQGKRTSEAEVEDFATWKKRILSEAGDDT